MLVFGGMCDCCDSDGTPHTFTFPVVPWRAASNIVRDAREVVLLTVAAEEWALPENSGSQSEISPSLGGNAREGLNFYCRRCGLCFGGSIPVIARYHAASDCARRPLFLANRFMSPIKDVPGSVAIADKQDIASTAHFSRK